jgi:transcription initiation factor TFIID subunit 11
MSSQASGPGASKKPKIHPLRQTSFPAQDASGRYGSAVSSARSETGSLANSMLSGVSGKVKGRGRGRPRKSAQLDHDDLRATHQPPGDSASQVDGDGRRRDLGAKSVVSARSGAADQEEDDDDEIDDMVENMDEQEQRRAEEEELRQEQRRKRLAEALDPDQDNRFGQWRALSLNTSTVKRLVNSIVSQSVTAAPLQAVKVYGKYFVGEIVERAREVQVEYAKAYDQTRKEEQQRRETELQTLEQKQKDMNASDPSSQMVARDIARLRREVKEYIPNPHRGGLLPDHLREALRRYKQDGEGGGVGFQGMSHGLLGVPGAAAWRVGDGASGRRLFR